MGQAISDYNMRLILLSVIKVSGGHCIAIVTIRDATNVIIWLDTSENILTYLGGLIYTKIIMFIIHTKRWSVVYFQIQMNPTLICILWDDKNILSINQYTGKTNSITNGYNEQNEPCRLVPVILKVNYTRLKITRSTFEDLFNLLVCRH